MTGAGLALPLLSAGGAQAADTTTWDRVAQCESGGMWSSASGNGFYGGLQLTQEMWDDYGGSAYASRPDLASRAQQIAVAQAILDDRGPDAFPSCALEAGLAKGGSKPGVDPGSTSRPDPRPSPSHPAHDDPADDAPAAGDPSGTAGEPGQAGPGMDTPTLPGSGSGSGSDADADTGVDAPDAPSATPAPANSASPSGPSSADPSPSSSGRPATPSHGAPSGTPSAHPSGPASTPPAAGRHRGAPEDGTGADGGRDGDGGRHPSRGGDAHRTPPAGTGDYRVRPGDNLSAIAEHHDLPGGWPALYDRNRDVVGADADLILPGQLLDLGRTQG
ncbi:transglycosylase family protein [Streptomyces sp. NPDC093707]|uniref:transglycosylase family protein n=1 Tax=Streptomyces sp. NPDC093707 TaxID=3154984 RepID=UPI00344F779A